ncbi:MAG TPA: alpha-glucan family phosphorylase [Gemmatimonadales bacterium]|nr:alpha-glucan family phosphorylase [Gemmatimonadales bacterium]
MTPSPTSSPSLPERIQGLWAVATNLSWSWNRDARALFRSIDQALWHLTRHNPIELLRRVDPARLAACAQDPAFLQRYDTIVAWNAWVAATHDTWFETSYPDLAQRRIAYFCAEFGLHNSVPIYSGGLGVLAGDHCKAASDLGVPLVGVGLFYTKGYSDQRLRLDGWQEDAEERFDVAATPLEQVRGPKGDPCLATVRVSGRAVSVGAWRVTVGRVPILLLDTGLEQNDPADRGLSNRLYAGGPELRLRQEWILGVAGVRVLRALGYDPVVWHANEGHAAFMLVERVRELVTRGTPFDEAVRRVRSTSVFTTHTPVPAGHDTFSLAELEQCTGPVWQEMGVSREQLFRVGHHPVRDHDLFHMPVAAIRLSAGVNGVSRRHGEESRRIWAPLWPGREAARVPIGHITNGVHVATWIANPLVTLLNAHLGQEWLLRLDEPALWSKVLELDDAALWAVHNELKSHLMRSIREQARRRWVDQWKEALHLVGAGTLLDQEALTIGFGRRFATYKRADLIFRDADRLQRLLVNPWRPVQIVFAGKAHPADEPGKQILQRVYAHTREARFEGRIAFIEDYEMHVAHRLVQGVDVWLNVPRPPLEACGTSGMKAGLNGVPQLSTLDGWWSEGYDDSNGWAIPPAPAGAGGVGGGQDRDAADAEQLYRLLEQEVVPLFYDRDARGVPRGWVEKMKHAMHTAGARFTAQRMIRQYLTEYYLPAIRGQMPDDPPTA